MSIEHELRQDEQLLLDGLIERFRFTPVVVRLSATMLKKSIIDARVAIQAYLARTGLVEYGIVGQGIEHRVQLAIPFVSGGISERRNVSFYRPKSKKGDPRLSVERLGTVAKADDALILAFTDSELVVIHLAGTVGQLATSLSLLLPSRFEERGQLEALIRHLGKTIKPLASSWVRTLRAGSTGVGFTFESLLGIRANNSRRADLDTLEVKAYRRGSSRGQGKLVDLFAKTPVFFGQNNRLSLVQDCGYDDPARNRRALYCTVSTSMNNQGLALSPDRAAERLIVTHRGRPIASYLFSVLESRLLEKHPATLFVKASARGKREVEEFQYDEVTLYQQPSLGRMLDLVKANQITLDLTLRILPSGAAKDHGFKWRIREASLGKLFAYKRAITFHGAE